MLDNNYLYSVTPEERAHDMVEDFNRRYARQVVAIKNIQKNITSLSHFIDLIKLLGFDEMSEVGVAVNNFDQLAFRIYDEIDSVKEDNDVNMDEEFDALTHEVSILRTTMFILLQENDFFDQDFDDDDEDEED
mgnify:CR=1 FL=1